MLPGIMNPVKGFSCPMLISTVTVKWGILRHDSVTVRAIADLMRESGSEPPVMLFCREVSFKCSGQVLSIPLFLALFLLSPETPDLPGESFPLARFR
jgi:hypothetical protein